MPDRPDTIQRDRRIPRGVLDVKTTMKLAIGIVVILLAIASLLAVPLVAHHEWASPDCASHIVVVTGPDGSPIECVCLDGALSTCFNPGP